MDDYTVRAMDLGLHILQLMGTHDSLTIRKAARLTGASVSRVHRALRTLEDRGFVALASSSRGYVPGPYLMGLLLTPGLQPREKFHLRPTLQEIRELTGEAVHSAVLIGNQVLVLDGRQSTYPAEIGLRIGMTAPAHSMAAGKLLLSQLDQAQVRALLPGDVLPRRGPKTITHLEALEVELRSIKTSKIAFTVQESEAGINSLAVPLAGSTWRDRVALVISLPVSRGTMPRMRELAKLSRAVIEERSLERNNPVKW